MPRLSLHPKGGGAIVVFDPFTAIGHPMTVTSGLYYPMISIVVNVYLHCEGIVTLKKIFMFLLKPDERCDLPGFCGKKYSGLEYIVKGPEMHSLV